MKSPQDVCFHGVVIDLNRDVKYSFLMSITFTVSNGCHRLFWIKLGHYTYKAV